MTAQPDPEEAQRFATQAHQQQQYDGQPYTVHLQHVVKLVHWYIYPLPREVVCAAWLHDVLEDTWAKEVDIGLHFGPRVLALVRLLTDEPGRNRKERHALTYPKLRTDAQAVGIKVCDRLANVQHNHERALEHTNNAGLFHMYAREYKEFRRALWRFDEHRALWRQLDALLLGEQHAER